MQKVIITILLICNIFSITAQNIEGLVLSKAENGTTAPIIGANVYWEGTTVGTATDINGKYSISQAPSFPATLNVSYVGHTLESKEVIDNKYIFYLRESIDLDEVEVSGQINTTKISTLEPLNIQTISTGEIQKAACCNLSECFETNNTVDVSYSDGVSGIKKIKMLGLDGQYIQITNELIPLVRGMQRSYGLSYIPGSWIESIQIIQGSGSVVNGFESFTGQINLEYFKPEEATNKINWNVYANSSGKIENNLILTKKKGKWQSNLFTHISYFDKEIDHHGYHHDHSDHTDHAGDKFLDMPKFKQFTVLNRWAYKDSEKYRFQVNVRGLIEERIAGQITTDKNITNPYSVNIDNKIIQVYTKFGKIKSDTSSFGSQTSLTLHNQKAKFGENIYTGIQESFSITIIEQKQLNDNHVLKYGGSYFADRFTESLEGNTSQTFLLKKRVDLVTGLFSEHQYQNEKINIITGLRADYYNIEEKIYYSPRLNAKYNPGDRTAIRFSIGKAFRISNFIVENINYLASSREIIFEENIKPETALNYGLNIAHCFYLFNKEGTINFDIYNTVFDNQIVVNIENKDEISFDNLNGNSSATSIQFGLDYKLIDQLQMRLGYKITNTLSTFNGEEKEIPLQPNSRGLLNLAYSTISDKWHFDITGNYIGKSRIPDNIASTEEYSSPFLLFNTQITRKWSDFDLYIGGENLSNYTQPNPIIDPENPFGENFDASLIWGPVMGRTIYAGLRYKIN
tara:strand:- start:27 stop:2252 length:2226 start_codon:yes stop_codon:yes gene_type:complete